MSALEDGSFVVVSGLSGAGRSTAAKCLEDLGYFVVDNLPPDLLPTMVDLGRRTQGAVDRIAVVADIRSRALSSDLPAAIELARERGAQPRVLFLEASDAVLVRRFESVRRPHPLQDGDPLTAGIARERSEMADVRDLADVVLDTSILNVHQLRAKIVSEFGAGGSGRELQLNVLSFGFKHGLPVDADLVLDARFLPNPHWIEELRPHNGTETPVRDFVLAQDGAIEFLDRAEGLMRLVFGGYVREDKHYALLAIGCTGGKHRSVALSEQLAERLSHMPGVRITLTHRDLGAE